MCINCFSICLRVLGLNKVLESLEGNPYASSKNVTELLRIEVQPKQAILEAAMVSLLRLNS